MGGFGESGLGLLDIAGGPVVAGVRRRFVMEEGGAITHRRFRVDDNGQLIKVKLDHLSRIARLIQRIGHNKSDGLTDIAQAVLGDMRLRDGRNFWPAHRDNWQSAGDWLQPVGDVFPCIECANTRRGSRLTCIQRRKIGVSDWGSQNVAIQAAFRLDIVDVLPCAL